MKKSWKIAHANFKNIYEKLNKNYTNISMLYEIILFLKSPSKQWKQNLEYRLFLDASKNTEYERMKIH